MMRHNHRFLFVIVALMVATVGILPRQAHAFSTGAKWRDRRTLTFRIDPNLHTLLGFAYFDQVSTPIKAAAQTWNAVSPFTLNYSAEPFNSSSTLTPNPGVTAANISLSDPCNPGTPQPSYIAVTCLFASPSEMSNAVLYFNTAKTWVNTLGGTWDVQSTALHEFGHFLSLNDDPPGQPDAVMTEAIRRTLHEDDMQGAIQIYGPYTGWEGNQAQGIRDRPTYADMTGVVGYSQAAGSEPEIIATTQDPATGVVPKNGTRYAKFEGYAQGPSVAWYNTLFHDETDPNQTLGNYLTIVPGMTLEWDQYNYQQSTISIDFAMTDETRLSTSNNIVDANGISVHPASRGGYTTGIWHHITVDLSPLTGKVIRRWMLGYDNSVSGQFGPFRVYFDNLKVTYSRPQDGVAPNMVTNYNFEGSNTANGWLFTPVGSSSWTMNGTPYQGLKAADVSISAGGSGTQLSQANLPLEPNTQYFLQFAAYSNNGNDMQVSLIKHISPFTNYGLNVQPNLTTSWNVFSYTFTTSGFTTAVSDGRLRFYFTSSTHFHIDNVVLRKVTP